METYTLDQTDLKLLSLLQQDGTMTYKELCLATHKTHHPIVERVNRLKKLGYIQKTVAVLDIKKIKSVFIAFPMIQLNSHSEETFRRFQDQIVKHPEIMECHHVMGQFDFILKIVVADAGAYNEFLRKHISTLVEVQRVESFPMLSEIKNERNYRF